MDGEMKNERQVHLSGCTEVWRWQYYSGVSRSRRLHNFGESEEYALYNIKEALEGYLCFLEIDDVEIPAESKLKYIGLCGGDATIIMVDVCTRSGSQQISKKDSYNS